VRRRKIDVLCSNDHRPPGPAAPVALELGTLTEKKAVDEITKLGCATSEWLTLARRVLDPP